jgi:hypothetical protein
MPAVAMLGMGYSLSCRARSREGDPRHFIGERDGNKLEGLGLDELRRP